MRVADQQVVRHVAAEHRVPFADARLQVLEDLVVRVGIRQELRRVGRAAQAERRRPGLQDRAVRVELVVFERHLVGVVDVVVALQHPGLGRRDLLDVVERTGVVLEVRLQVVAEGRQIGRVHARRVAGDRRAARIRRERRQRPRVFLFLELAEIEQLVLHDRTAGPEAPGLRVEIARVEAVRAGGRADEAGAGVHVGQIRAVFVAGPVVGGRGEGVVAAARHGVDAGAGEVALAHVVRRHAHLHLLDRFQRDRRDARAVADAAGRDAEAERIVEVGAVDRDVVRTVVLAGERAAAAVLRRQARDVGDAARDGRERREVLAHHGRGGARARRAEHRIALADDGDRLGDVSNPEGEVEILRDAQAHADVVLRFRREAGERRRDRVRTADPHAGDHETSVDLRHRLVCAARWLVHGEDGGARNHGTLRILDDAAGCASGHALRVRAAGGPQQNADREHCQRSKKGSATHVVSMAYRHARLPFSCCNGLVRRTRGFYRGVV